MDLASAAHFNLNELSRSALWQNGCSFLISHLGKNSYHNMRLQQSLKKDVFIWKNVSSSRAPASGWTLNSHGKAQKRSFMLFSGLFLFNTKIWLPTSQPFILTSWSLSSFIKCLCFPCELLFLVSFRCFQGSFILKVSEK